MQEHSSFISPNFGGNDVKRSRGNIGNILEEESTDFAID